MNRYVYATFFIVVGFLAVVALNKCSDSKDPTPDPVTKIVECHDTVWIGRPTEVEVEYIEILADVDTESIIREYFKQTVYVDTVRPNEFVTVVVHDTVFQNALVGQKFDFITEFSLPVPADKSRSLSVGVCQGVQECNLSLDYKWNKHWAVSAGYDILQKTPTVGIKYTLLQWQ